MDKWIIKYQITAWSSTGEANRITVDDLGTAKHIASLNSRIHPAKHLVIKRLRSQTGWVGGPYYDLVGAYVNGTYYTRLVWRKMHPFNHSKKEVQ